MFQALKNHQTVSGCGRATLCAAPVNPAAMPSAEFPIVLRANISKDNLMPFRRAEWATVFPVLMATGPQSDFSPEAGDSGKAFARKDVPVISRFMK